MLRFYFDQHIKIAIARGLQRRGVDVLRTQDDGTSEWADEQILLRASELGRIVFTNDEDFLRIGKAFQQAERRFAGIVFASAESVSIGRAISDLELIAKAMDPEDLAGQVMRLPL